MDELYSIGETAALNDVSVKRLRYYDDIGLLRPAHIDPETGYRYYNYSQFSYIDKIKRYQSIGMPLREIKKFFDTKSLAVVEAFLREQRENLAAETRRLEAMKRDVDWLTEFFEYSKSMKVDSKVYEKHFPPRNMIRVDCDGDESIYAMDLELRHIASAPELRGLQILNPYGYILDYTKLTEGRFYPLASTVSVAGNRGVESEYLFLVPEGNYLCCRTNILSEHWDISGLLEAFRKRAPQNPLPFVIACEFLSSFYDPRNSPYELQILLDSTGHSDL